MSYKTLQTDRNFRGNTAEIGKKKATLKVEEREQQLYIKMIP